jgi:hypothetical protein
MGSTGKETFRIEWQVLHSKVRSSKPRSPGEIRANPILCLQVGHDGRSVMELLITTRHSEANDRYGQNRSVRLRILSDKILAQLLRDREPGLKIGIGSAGHGWMRDRHGLGPEAPLSPKGGVVLVWVQQNCCQADAGWCPQGPSGTRLRWPFPKMDGHRERGAQFCYPCAFICSLAPLSLRVGAISPSSQSCS